MTAPSAPRACPRTGRRRATALDPGAVRPSDMLVAFFACALVALAAAAAVALIGTAAEVPRGRWLALHLAFVGGVSQLVLGAAQFFTCAFLATDPPPRRMLRAQLVAWNAGAVAIAVGVPAGITPLTAAGGVLVLAGLGLFAAALRGLERRSLQSAPWAARWYRAAALFLAVGAVLGPLMAAGVSWTHGSLLAAHLTVNIAGWFGTAIVGTLHTFFPSLTGTRLRRPGLQSPTFAFWTAGVAAVALGCAFDARTVATAGWVSLGVAAVMLAANLLASARGAERVTPAAALVGAAQLFLPAAVVAGAVLTLDAGPFAPLVGENRDVVATLAVAGWIGLTVAGSLIHLLGLMSRVRAMAGPAGRPPRRAPSLGLAAAATTAVAMLAVARASGDAVPLARALVAALYAGLGARIVVLAVRAVRAAPLRI